ncbi:carbohydrate ABC transporter permease [Cohnella sp. WQ 127256]|uniref:carbohydrate ABC transporter permease n=1 Tax=Cohnella sp. WQ 127256 TaxID=2938790 RepID=UPI002118C0CE|nr:carbohydrate ABC transporter permease [Cohnella sp. WQ 127256]
MKTSTYSKIGIEIVMIACTAIIFYPIIMILMISVKTNSEASSSPLSFPSEFVFQNYVDAFQKMNYMNVFTNSVTLTAISTIAGVLLYALAAYGIARAKRWKWLFRSFYLLFIIGQVLPSQTSLPPLIFIMRELHLMNSIPGVSLIIIGGGTSLAILLLCGFINTVPMALEESAKIDGAGPLQIFSKITLRLMVPPIMTLVILNVVAVWNDFMTPLLFLPGKSARTIPLEVFYFKGEYITSWNLLFAALILSMIPLLVVFFFLQRYIISGLMSGAVK